MKNSFENKIAVVTGAASGLGLALVQQLAERGVKLALLDKNEEALLKLRATLPALAEIFPVDVSNEQEVKQAIELVTGKFGAIHILINCAGITGKTNIKSHETEAANLRAVMDINFMGSYFTSRYTLPVMLRQQYGRILHIASIAGKEGNAGMLAYSASKAAVIAMTKVQGKEYAGTGVTINALAPAVIKTALVEAMPGEQVKYMTDKIPMQRCGTLEEFAAMAAFIVSEENSFTTGFTFDLSGGRATY